MARKFFYICAGLFLLALSYHLGAQAAQAQVGSDVQGAALAFVPAGFGVRASGVVGRVFYSMLDNGAIQALSPAIPGTQPILATDPAGRNVLLADGEVLQYNGAGWNLLGNLFPGPVPALHESWGALKSRYAPNGGTVSKGADAK